MPEPVAISRPAQAAMPSSAGDILPLRAEALSFEAGGRRLVDAVDLDLGPGTRTIVMGPNGAGKSLLLRLLHGLIRPSGGRVLWNGRPADAAVLRRQAMVFQHPVLLRRSVSANIAYALKVRRLPVAERRARVADMLELANLEALAHAPARVLSGGEQQRLALARALATRPEILFLDEPTSSLDPAATAAIERIVWEAADRGTKIVMVTHDIGQARRLADEIVFMHRGRVAERSAAFRFFQAPVSAPAADFLSGKLVL
ncbi:ATP-binding cassette domain-containing protein [Microbaculum marinum]|uniref:ATP-binding cassette domain-containing protein n=1 Tax=Microbaculum marinum TaxID=1764581 RepID=A0AAW9RXG2_9HYPH